tara:strand:- start:183 stop:1433 length:1251 start_codon:yes stop_codon:yes gene_type:complete
MVEKVINETGELINLGDVGKHEYDPASLCGSKHEVAIGTTVNTEGLTPFNDYIIIYFRPYDTSGGGILMEWLGEAVAYATDVGAGGIKIFTDPGDWITTVGTGLAHEDSPIGRDSAVGQVAVDSGFAQGYVDAVDWLVGGSDDDASTCYLTTAVLRAEGNANSSELNSMRKLRDSYGIWFAEQEVAEYYRIAPTIVQGINRHAQSEKIYRHLHSEYILPAHEQVKRGNFPQAHTIYRNMVNQTRQFAVEDASTSCGNSVLDTWAEYTGGCYHGLAGNYHKVRITITCTYEGKTTTKYRSDLAGCPAQYEEDSWCENGEVYKRFLFNSPGTWTVEVKPISTNTCANLDYTETATFEVAEPEGWTPSPMATLSTDVSVALQDAGIPVAVRPIHIVGAASLVGGLLLFKIYKKKKAKAE